MLEIIIPEQEYFDRATMEFCYVTKPVKLRLEHSLISIAKWEMKWHKSYFSDYKKATYEESFDYIRCMLLDPPPPDEVLKCISSEDAQRIKDYIEDPMSSVTFSEHEGGRDLRRKKHLANEDVYSSMIALGMDAAHYEKWHINRLLTLIRVVSIDQSPPKKGSRSQTMDHYMRLNAKHRKALNSKG